MKFIRKIIADKWHFHSFQIILVCIFEIVYFHFAVFPCIKDDLSIIHLLYISIVCPILIAALAFFVGIFVLAFTYPIIYSAISRINGGPFKIGDEVQLLTSRLYGKKGIIYSMWQGSGFRVDIGADYKNDLNDIFDGEMVRMVKKSTQQLNAPEPLTRPGDF